MRLGTVESASLVQVRLDGLVESAGLVQVRLDGLVEFASLVQVGLDGLVESASLVQVKLDGLVESGRIVPSGTLGGGGLVKSRNWVSGILILDILGGGLVKSGNKVLGDMGTVDDSARFRRPIPSDCFCGSRL